MNIRLANLERCSECPIRHRAVCARCDEDELAKLETIKYYRTYESGQKILWRGDSMENLSSVVDGVASISQTMEDGRTQMVGLLLPSDFIGRPGRDKAPYDVTAVTDVTLCCFRRRPFEELAKKTPHVNERLLEMALDELDAARDWMLLLGRKTAREKIASFMLMIAKRTKLPEDTDNVGRIELPLTRESMADYLGLTLETVSRQVSALKREKIIRLDGKRGVDILNHHALVLASGDDNDLVHF